jgi:hypothetical protein
MNGLVLLLSIGLVEIIIVLMAGAMVVGLVWLVRLLKRNQS